MISAYKNLVGKSEGKRSLGRYRRRWEDNIRSDLNDKGYKNLYCYKVAQDKA
jgi:hypothetical protein